jgi:ABC-type spermidine/putrescine transport system permease subunit II
MLGDLGPSLGWAITMMASVDKIVAPVLLAGESVRTLGLWLFCALIMSPRGEILDFPAKPLI